MTTYGVDEAVRREPASQPEMDTHREAMAEHGTFNREEFSVSGAVTFISWSGQTSNACHGRTRLPARVTQKRHCVSHKAGWW